MKTLPVTACVLTHKSIKALPNTLQSYKDNGLFNIVDEVILFVNECTTDYELNLAEEYGITHVITKDTNVGIGAAMLEMAHAAKNDYVIFLEDDFILTESREFLYKRLRGGIDLLDKDFKCIKLRSAELPGHPLFSKNPYTINPLNHYDSEIDAVSPHLLESYMWLKRPDLEYPDYIYSQLVYDEMFFCTTSKYGNWSNTPAMYDKQFLINTISQFDLSGIGLEGSISKWWNRQEFDVAACGGAFTHFDLDKYN